MLALNFRTSDDTAEVDLLVSHSEEFEQLRHRAIQVSIGDRTFSVASIDDLIAMKRRSGRPIDLLDVQALQSIRRRIDGPP